MKPLGRLLGTCCLLLYTHSHAAEAPCRIASAQDVLLCAAERHPDVLRAKAELHAAVPLEAMARQRPNPEIDAEVTGYRDDDQPSLKTEAAYRHTFELGDKRGWRIQEAKARRQIAQARLARLQNDITVDTVVKLHRLRQLTVELRAVEEAIQTFQTILKTYDGRSHLSPEQDVSRHVFLLAGADYRFRRSTLIQERNGLKTWFELATAVPFEQLQPLLPAPMARWPEMVERSGTAPSVRQEAAAALAQAEASLGSERGKSWPDLQAGPRIDSESGRGHNTLGLGGVLSLGLPLYHRNQGAKDAARLEQDRAQLHLSQTERELAAERARLLTLYRDSVETYQESPSTEKLERYHERMEKEFERGLVSPALIIEAHRQMVDYTKARHEQERRALEALWTLYILDGRLSEAAL